ncbi:hypothetical protein ACSBR2_018941 [Camellia fascicularis]
MENEAISWLLEVVLESGFHDRDMSSTFQMVPGQFFYRRWSWCGQRTNNCRVDLREQGRRKALWNFNTMAVLM